MDTQRTPKFQARGFTLIELMIVVAVVAILSAIAYPSYAEYVRRGNRADARAGLLQAQQWLERAATAAGVYPTSLPTALTWSGDGTRLYTIGFQSGNSGTTYTLVATRKSGTGQANDRCGDFTLSNTGVQGNNNLGSGATTPDCWRK